MIVLVLNTGSSSVKYQVINPEEKKALATGVVERIGMSGAILTHRVVDGEEIRLSGEILDHKMAIEYVLSIQRISQVFFVYIYHLENLDLLE